MANATDCRFSDTHEWFCLDGDVVTVGLSQFAANELTDITYVELKPVGTTISAGEPIGEVESVKSTSDIYSAVDGEIIAVNDHVTKDPSLINSDSTGEGWLVRIRTSDPSPLDALMDQGTYDEKHPVG